MKVVVDTNVLVAGLLSPFGPPAEIVRMIASGAVTLCVDARILTEYAEVLSRPKFQFETEQVQTLLEQIRLDGLSVAGTPLASRLPDPTDEPFLEAAIAGDAACVITGNAKHFPAPKRQGIAVVSPAQFLDLYRNQPRQRKRL
ncbi:MAG: putative toxin-antitoxin system toxin component, PIN family [Nitrospira sp.]|nr:putative toxin-antitoxin system toxin component, PIN family [Nitrospira sp.]